MSLIEAYSIKNHDSTRPILFEEVTVHIAIQTQQKLATFLEGPAFSCTDIWSHTFRSCIFSVPSPRLHVCVVRCFWCLCARLQAAVVARGTATHSHPASLYTDTCIPFSLHRYYRTTQTLKSKIEPRAHYALEPVQGHGASCGSLWNSWALCHTVHRELQHKGSDNSADTGVRLWTNKEMCDCCNAWRTKSEDVFLSELLHYIRLTASFPWQSG